MKVKNDLANKPVSVGKKLPSKQNLSVPPLKPSKAPPAKDSLVGLPIDEQVKIIYDLNQQLNPNQPSLPTKEVLKEYLESLVDADRDKLAKLMQRNLKLKAEIEELNKGMQNVMVKEKEKRISKVGKKPIFNQQIKEQQEELKKQSAIILQLKNDIKRKRAELENTFQIEMLREKRNELASLKKQLEELKNEKELLDKINKDQEQFIKGGADSVEEQRISELNEKLRAFREELRAVTDEKTRLEKEAKALHANLYKEKLKQKEKEKNALELLKSKKEKKADEQVLTIEAYEEQLKSLKSEIQKEKEESDKALKELEKKRKETNENLEHQEENLKKMEYDVRNNSLKLKNLQRANKLGTLKPVEDQKVKKTRLSPVKKAQEENVDPVGASRGKSRDVRG